MNICPNCGAVVPGIDVVFHKCAPSIENGKSKDVGLQWWLKNTTIISIPIWLVTLFIPKFIIGELGIVLGLTVLRSPPLLIWFTWNLKLKGENEYAIVLSVIYILILMVSFSLLILMRFTM